MQQGLPDAFGESSEPTVEKIVIAAWYPYFESNSV